MGSFFYWKMTLAEVRDKFQALCRVLVKMLVKCERFAFWSGFAAG
jgi:hypothetical protein